MGHLRDHHIGSDWQTFRTFCQSLFRFSADLYLDRFHGRKLGTSQISRFELRMGFRLYEANKGEIEIPALVYIQLQTISGFLELCLGFFLCQDYSFPLNEGTTKKAK